MRCNHIITFTAVVPQTALNSSKQVLEFIRMALLRVHFNLVRFSSWKKAFWFFL